MNVSLTPTSNVTVMQIDDELDPCRKEPGGQHAGGTNTLVARVYEQFSLPAYKPGTSVVAADFNSYYGPDEGASGNLYVYSTANGWDGDSIEWQNAPQGQDLLATLTMQPGQAFHADLTSYVDDAYKNGGVVSLIIMDKQEEPSITSYRTLSAEKHLDLTIS
jgi:hypothetical protein